MESPITNAGYSITQNWILFYESMNEFYVCKCVCAEGRG